LNRSNGRCRWMGFSVHTGVDVWLNLRVAPTIVGLPEQNSGWRVGEMQCGCIPRHAHACPQLRGGGFFVAVMLTYRRWPESTAFVNAYTFAASQRTRHPDATRQLVAPGLFLGALVTTPRSTDRQRCLLVPGARSEISLSLCCPTFGAAGLLD
jgi:hypothetical protein